MLPNMLSVLQVPTSYYWNTMGVTLIYWIIFFGVWIAIGLACAIFVYRDARNSRMNRTAWAIIAFFLAFIGLVIYLLMKNSKG